MLSEIIDCLEVHAVRHSFNNTSFTSGIRESYLNLGEAFIPRGYMGDTWTCENGVSLGSTRVNAFTWYYGSGVNLG